jgi:hypothetical protein
METIKQRLIELLGKFTVVYLDPDSSTIKVELFDNSEIGLITLLEVQKIVQTDNIIVSINYGHCDDRPELALNIAQVGSIVGLKEAK